MKVKTASILLSSFLVTTLICMNLLLVVQRVSATWVLVPNGSFESGTVGLIPDNWVMITRNRNELGVENVTYINEMQQTDQQYFEGERSLWMHSRVVDTDGLKNSRWTRTEAVTEDWINAPFATRVRIYIRNIRSTHSLGWGWYNSIILLINNVSVARTLCYDGKYRPMIFTNGETLNWNHYNYTAIGADGESWYVYEYGVPESIDKTHMKIQIVCMANDWTFYSTSYYSDLEFVVDKVELFSPPPQYTLTVDSSPTGVTFTVDGVPHTTSWSGTYNESTSVSLVMPETYVGYVWSHWLEDGDPNRIKIVTMDTNITLTGVYATKPVGGKAAPINIPMNKPETPTLWIWLSAVILPLVLTALYIKKRKRYREIIS